MQSYCSGEDMGFQHVGFVGLIVNKEYSDGDGIEDGDDATLVSEGVIWSLSSVFWIFCPLGGFEELDQADFSSANTKVLRMVNSLAVDNEAKQTIDALQGQLQKT
ncbi:hypothetical protein RHSIM_RhsimUnG0219700 [Rhododendron simsii]|uniref:Uncharacterized protein n=1 Tax=Rhododendron simsii TaxID=118357 RepID=A0A834FYM1_RHOSS|nr:hypothetical protein RHSIM_RhsimUnG0219700 [Rhododendron simsii]